MYDGQPSHLPAAALRLVFVVFGALNPLLSASDPLEHLPARQFSSPAELLAVYGISGDELASFADGQPMDASERQTLIRILFRIPQFPQYQLESWASHGVSRGELAASPETHRTRAIRLRGRVRSVAREPMLRDLALGFGFDAYYRVHVETEEGGACIVYTRAIPEGWQQTDPTGTPVQTTALFLKTAEVGQRAALTLVASHLAWFPEQADLPAGLSANQVFLAQRGMDLGLFDPVRKRNRMEVGSEDRECFYQLMAVVDRITADEFASRAPDEFELARLLQEPDQQHGQIQQVKGTARRITRVVVEDRDVQQRLGIDHYFQIDMFVPLGNQVVRLGRADEGETPTFSNTYPVTVCVRTLPDELSVGQQRQEMRIPAVFFKLWAYRSQFVSSYDTRQLQISPMLIGAQPVLISRDLSSSSSTGLGLAVAFLLFFAGIWIWAWRFQRQDAAVLQQTRQRRFQLPKGKPFDALSRQVRNQPDFSELGDFEEQERSRAE